MRNFIILILLMISFSDLAYSTIVNQSGSPVPDYFALCPDGKKLYLSLNGYGINANPQGGSGYPAQFELDGPLSHNGGMTIFGPNLANLNLGTNTGRNSDFAISLSLSTTPPPQFHIQGTAVGEDVDLNVPISSLSGNMTIEEPYILEIKTLGSQKTHTIKWWCV